MHGGLALTFYIKFAFTTASLLPLVCMVGNGINILYKICLYYSVFVAFSKYGRLALTFYIEFAFTTASLLPLMSFVHFI